MFLSLCSYFCSVSALIWIFLLHNLQNYPLKLQHGGRILSVFPSFGVFGRKDEGAHDLKTCRHIRSFFLPPKMEGGGGSERSSLAMQISFFPLFIGGSGTCCLEHARGWLAGWLASSPRRPPRASCARLPPSFPLPPPH